MNGRGTRPNLPRVKPGESKPLKKPQSFTDIENWGEKRLSASPDKGGMGGEFRGVCNLTKKKKKKTESDHKHSGQTEKG